MKYKIILEAELEGIEDAAAVLSDISARLSRGNMKVALLDVCGGSPSSIGTDMPSKAEVECYFSALRLPAGVCAREEAMRFYSYNASSGWKYAAIWQKLARDWVARIRVDGHAKSFDADEFFDAALKKSYNSKTEGI